jgi:hypothetical protein
MGVAKSKSISEIDFKLETYDKFAQALSPNLKSIPLRKRKLFLEYVYKLAAQKVKKEWLRRDLEQRAIVLRKYRLKMERTRAHLKNAATELERAHSSYPNELPNRFDTKGIIPILNGMSEGLAAFEKKLASSVHPELRSAAEKRIPDEAITFSELVPGMNLTAIDYWFISEAEKWMNDFAVQQRILYGRGDYNNIITAIFKVAFDKRQTVGKIKSARRRIAARKKTLQGSRPIQNN